MLAKKMLTMMLDYDHYINNRLLDLALNVTPEQWMARQDFDQRSLHETFFHILAVEEEWVYFCQTGTSRWNYRQISDYPDAASLRAFSDRVYAANHAYLDSMDEAQLQATVHDTMPEGVKRTAAIWYLFVHMLYHSAQHRSEIASILTRYEHSPREIDFYGFGGWGIEVTG